MVYFPTTLDTVSFLTLPDGATNVIRIRANDDATRDVGASRRDRLRSRIRSAYQPSRAAKK